MKKILTEKVAPDFGCILDTKLKIVTYIDLPISHYFVGQNNCYKETHEFAVATIDNVYIVYTKGFKQPYIQFDYTVTFLNGQTITRNSRTERVEEGKVKKKWFGYFNIDDIYIGNLIADKLTDCRQVAITEYAHIKEREYIDLITKKIGKRMHRNFSQQVQFVDFKDAQYNALLDMIDVVELAPIDIEPYLTASDASKEIKDAYREYAKMEFEKYLASSSYNKALDDYHPRISLNSIELYEYKVTWIAEHTDVYKDSKKFIDDIDTNSFKTSEYDNFIIKKSKKK
ncbi:MAG: hypothetical protein ACI4V7_12675 [Succinivibrionaceae bacterium]